MLDVLRTDQVQIVICFLDQHRNKSSCSRRASADNGYKHEQMYTVTILTQVICWPINGAAMKRSEFLRGLGAIGLVSALPAKTKADELANPVLPAGVDCVVIPQETEGPYPLDLSSDPTKFRQDITEGRPGVFLRLVLTLVNINDSCKPIPNARVDIWHTDKDGVSSGFNQPGANTVGETFMRGIQITDANGRVEFTTIYPGWYPGRITHIHFQVFIGSVLSATSQMAFPEEVTKMVYGTPLYSAKGQNTSVSGNSEDNIFASPINGLQYQMLTLINDLGTGGYTGSMTIGVDAPATGLRDHEPETGGQFVLSQNYPNPFNVLTTFSFSLANTSHVVLRLFDMNGRAVGDVFEGDLPPGDHKITADRKFNGLTLPTGTYMFDLIVQNMHGRFHQMKTMTVQ